MAPSNTRAVFFVLLLSALFAWSCHRVFPGRSSGLLWGTFLILAKAGYRYVPVVFSRCVNPTWWKRNSQSNRWMTPSWFFLFIFFGCFCFFLFWKRFKTLAIFLTLKKSTPTHWYKRSSIPKTYSEDLPYFRGPGPRKINEFVQWKGTILKEMNHLNNRQFSGDMLVWGGSFQKGLAASRSEIWPAILSCQVLFESLTLDTLVSAYIRTVRQMVLGSITVSVLQIRMMVSTINFQDPYMEKTDPWVSFGCFQK